MHNKIIALMFTTIIITNIGCKNDASFAPSSEFSIENDRNTKKVIWYKVTQPLKNSGPGRLLIKTIDGKIDTSDLKVDQIGLAVSLLNSNNVYYNDSTRHLILIESIEKTNDTTQNTINSKKSF